MSSFSRSWRQHGADGELVKVQEWHFEAVREQKWAPVGGHRMEHFLEEQQSHRVWEQRGFGPRSAFGRRQMVVSLKELPVDYRRRRPSFQRLPPAPSAAAAMAPPSPRNRSFRAPSPMYLQPRQQQVLVNHQIHQQRESQWKAEERRQSNGELKELVPTPTMPTKENGHLQPNEPPKQQVRETPQKPSYDVPQVTQSERQLEEHKSVQMTPQNVDPDQEIENQQQGFRIRVEAVGFNDKDFKVSIDSARVLALDGEHMDDNGNGTVTIKKLNRRWKLAEDVDLRSVRAFLAADGHVEILGEKMAEPDEADGNEQPHIDEDLGAEPEDMAPPPPHLSERAEQASLQAMPPTPAFAPIAGAGKF